MDDITKLKGRKGAGVGMGILRGVYLNWVLNAKRSFWNTSCGTWNFADDA